MIAGVAGGLAEYFDIDPVLIRVLFVVGIFLGGGILAYIILWIVIPEEPVIFYQGSGQSPNENSEAFNNQTDTLNKIVDEAKNNRTIIGGITLITIGLILLLDNVIPNIHLLKFWPIIIIILGISIILKDR